IEMFQNAMRMFTPFPPAGSGPAAPEPGRKEEAKATEKADELLELKEQIAAMQRKLDKMS
ncbi:MAG TPA: polyhydroxyalkanoate synthesis repressor PhaR, partial [Mesorhizobium sp.]|nr:polyhydroxyalkanoate synthesis repressor PhaR [Mesorhizobium sp.]